MSSGREMSGMGYKPAKNQKWENPVVVTMEMGKNGPWAISSISGKVAVGYNQFQDTRFAETLDQTIDKEQMQSPVWHVRK